MAGHCWIDFRRSTKDISRDKAGISELHSISVQYMPTCPWGSTFGFKAICFCKCGCHEMHATGECILDAGKLNFDFVSFLPHTVGGIAIETPISYVPSKVTCYIEK